MFTVTTAPVPTAKDATTVVVAANETNYQSPERMFAVVMNMRRMSETRRSSFVRTR